MRIIDENGQEMQSVDYNLGYCTQETINIAAHPAQERIPEQAHYEVIREYPNGGKDMVKVVDVPFQPAKPAWVETEQILRWHWYTPENPNPTIMLATDNIEKDQYFICQGVLYYATEAIPKWILIKENTNCIKLGLADAFNQEANNGKTDL